MQASHHQQTDLTSTPPLPPRHAWFAPWRWCSHWRPWKRWTLLAVIMLSPVMYLLSDVPVWYALHKAGIFYDRRVHALYDVVYAPSYWYEQRFPTPVLGIRQLQDDWLVATFGPMRVRRSNVVIPLSTKDQVRG
jgi:hypothetical protein